MDEAFVIDDSGVIEWTGEDCACEGVAVAHEVEVAVDRPTLDAGAEPTVDDSAVTSSTILAEPAVESVVAPPPGEGTAAPEGEPLIAVEPIREELPPTPDSLGADVQQATALDLDHEASLPADPGAAEAVRPIVDEASAPAGKPVEPVEPNLFEEADAAAAAPVDEPAPPAATEPVGNELDADDDDQPPSAAEPLAAAVGPAEPIRRWIDRSGGYAVVGSLVAVREDGTCVLAAGGRKLAVPMDALSDHDRDYAARAGKRLAAAAASRVRDTAGL